MKIQLAKTFSKEFDKTTKDSDIEELEIKLQSSLEKNDYGHSVVDYLIGIICVHPNFDPFFKPKRPSYVENKNIKLEGFDVNIYKTFSLDIKLNFEDFFKSDKENGLKMVANEIITTIRDLKYPAKIKDFDREQFFHDLNCFFEQENLI
ncbi:hypothetical protein [Limibacterium fermenti]|uniref:hypothetical protein n=1 Tax=Limibacterium fermenti TaxID=3229863 RepID=UPI003A70A44F